jgi:hypothetical protein
LLAQQSRGRSRRVPISRQFRAQRGKLCIADNFSE